MAILELNIPDQLFDEWLTYADAAGLSVEALIQEAATHSVRNDRLGVEQARLQRLLRETREMELLARQGKTMTPTETKPRVSETSPSKPAVKKEQRSSKPELQQNTQDNELADAHVPPGFFEETGNMANLDFHIPREI